MTSQVKEVNEEMEALKVEAKGLKIEGWHLFKDPAKLQLKIDEAKASGNVRKKAPSIQVATGATNRRKEMIRKLEQDDPDSTFLTQAASLSADELRLKGFEVVKKENGETLRCGDDIVCRTDKQGFRDWQNDRTIGHLNSMKSIDKDLSTEGGGSRIQSVTEQTKSAIDAGS